jgi:hypothetical protein
MTDPAPGSMASLCGVAFFYGDIDMRPTEEFQIKVSRSLPAARGGVRKMTVVVRKPYAYLVESLASVFQGHPDAEVIVDRRRGERRHSEKPVAFNRRRAERRRKKEAIVDVDLS